MRFILVCAAERLRLVDHSADWRLTPPVAMALVVSTGGAYGASSLLGSIAITAHLFWFGHLLSAFVTAAALGLCTTAIPVVGRGIVGLIARVARLFTDRIASASGAL